MVKIRIKLKEKMKRQSNVSDWEIVWITIAAILFLPGVMVIANRVLYLIYLADIASKSS